MTLADFFCLAMNNKQVGGSIVKVPPIPLTVQWRLDQLSKIRQQISPARISEWTTMIALPSYDFDNATALVLQELFDLKIADKAVQLYHVAMILTLQASHYSLAERSAMLSWIIDRLKENFK